MNKILILIAVCALLSGCGKSQKPGDTPTSGTISLTVDEGLKPLISAEIAAFEGIYTNAHFKVKYVSEGEAILAVLQDSARACIVTRMLAPMEEESLTKQKYKARQMKVAVGGIALIVNNTNADTIISLQDVKRILAGEIKNWNWNKAPKKIAPAGMEVVFDQPNSGIIRFLKDSLVRFDSLPSNWFAVKGNTQVVDYVSKNPQAMGIIDIAWISDQYDSTANKFLSSVKVMAISTDSGSYQPYQAYIAQKRYPLRRDVIMISREAKSGLASGFMSFIAGQKGQLIVYKSGLVPATMPVRIVEINHDPISISR